MKKILSIFALSLLLMAWGCEGGGDDVVSPDDESTEGPISVQYVIYYTSSDGEIVNPKAGALDFGANLIGNSYSDNQGVLMFDAPITSIGRYAFFNCSSLTSVTIPDSVTSIGEGAFQNCSSLQSITIPDSVTSIGGSAFSHCSSLTSVTIGDSVTSIGEGAFYNCSSLESITIPDSVTSIGDYAFNHCSSLESITIPDSVTWIGEEAFYGCSSLTAFYGKFASADNRCLIIDGVLNSFAPRGLTSYTIPDSVTSIGDDAFLYCRSLTSVTIPDSVTEIGDRAFQNCSSLQSITIPDSVTSIGGSAFSNCSSLTSVTIGDSVTSIGDYAFYRCSSLTSVYCKPTTPPTGGEYMFSYYNNGSYYPIGCKIYVPTASVSAYKAKQYWSSYANYIVGYDF